jgi:F5/8 type C domain-containing protein/alpha-L-rhamnosidase-like protein
MNDGTSPPRFRRLGRDAIRRLALLALLPRVLAGQTPATTVIDDFEKGVSTWTTHPSDGTTMKVSSAPGHAGKGMRIDFTFSGGGYAIVRKELPLDLPDNYELSIWIRGTAPTENLEVKLVDSTGENVWWRNQRDVEFPRAWQRLSIKKRQISFAWGPRGGGELRRAAALEISVTAGSGGRGTVWLDDIILEPRAPVATRFTKPVVTASSSARGSRADAVVDTDSTTIWRSSSLDSVPRLTLDFGAPRELGGVVIDWAPSAYATSYDVQTSSDSVAWENAYSVRGGNGERDYIYLPETETRYLRIAIHGGDDRSFGIRTLTVEPISWSESRNAFFAAVAHDAPHGDYPKYLDGVQSYWTIVGVNGDEKEALLNEQGMLEVDKSAFSLEPSLFVDGRYVSWPDAQTATSLADNQLPIPTVTWKVADLRLDVTAFADGAPGASTLWARYRLTNSADSARKATLFVAVKPFQVNPPAQFLNTPGGASVIRSIAYDGDVVRVTGDARVGTKTIVSITKPTAFGTATFDAGGIAPRLHRGVVPGTRHVDDALGAASGAFSYEVTLGSRDSAEVWIAVPFHATSPLPQGNRTPRTASFVGRARLEAAMASWRSAVGRVSITLPTSVSRVTESLAANLADMLITRDGPSLEPGARSYERSWIRDGSMMASALLRLGHAEEARQYIEWYARFQYPNGKVPCCVDHRGADPVPENDSHGELVFAVAEYYRYTRDRAFLERMWPRVAKAVSYIDSLRHSRMTPEYMAQDKRAFYGLMPQSISHEGYSAKPMHSYWDDAFTLRGLKDATEIATVLGRPERAAYARMRDEFRRDLMASYRLTMERHKIDYLPGSVELGDFDATSTTVSVAPGGELDSLPHPALDRTFEKYYENFVARRTSNQWEGYTPYELRVVGTMVRLGWRRRAHELLDFFFHDQRPAAWRAWAEVVYRDSTTTKFIGDLPHTWVGSDYIRSVLDMLAYERESDSALVLGAGIVSSWVTDAPGVVVRRLPTSHGPLDFTMRANGDTVRSTIGATRVPRGGFVVHSPFERPIRRVLVNGATATPLSDGTVVVRVARATVVFEY